jgi:hypothetical protein
VSPAAPPAAECLLLHGSQLTQHIHPPPALAAVDVLRLVDKHTLLDRATIPALSVGDTLHLQMTPTVCAAPWCAGRDVGRGC